MSLKIAVLVKQVPDHEAIIQVQSDQKLEIEDRYVCNFFDEIAMEAALNIKKNQPDTDIVALSAGGRRSIEALRRAVAMGIDQVEHLGNENLEQADISFLARVLAAGLKLHKPDLIICGKQAGDDDFAAIGPMVADVIDIPHVSGVVSLDFMAEKNMFRIGRELEQEIWYLESGLPLLVTAEKGLAEPHVPVVTRVMKAMRTNVINIPVDKLDLPTNEPGNKVSRLRFLKPPSRSEVIMMQQPFPKNVSELIEHLQEKGILS